MDCGAHVANLGAVSEYLKRLHAVLPVGEWSPLYPEYYHTEALLAFELGMKSALEGKTEVARGQLLLAINRIRAAIKLRDANEFRDLERKVSGALKRVSGSNAPR